MYAGLLLSSCCVVEIKYPCRHCYRSLRVYCLLAVYSIGDHNTPSVTLCLLKYLFHLNIFNIVAYTDIYQNKQYKFTTGSKLKTKTNYQCFIRLMSTMEETKDRAQTNTFKYIALCKILHTLKSIQSYLAPNHNRSYSGLCVLSRL